MFFTFEFPENVVALLVGPVETRLCMIKVLLSVCV